MKREAPHGIDSAEIPIAILLVDDQPANLLALRALLDELGHELVEAHSGEEAVAKARESDFALILLAVQLPGLSGFETAQRLRAQERSARTPILFLSAHESADFSPAKAYALGAVDYLLQPLIPEILRAKVSQFVSLRRDTRAKETLRQGDAESRRLLEFHEAVVANMGEGLYAVDTQGLLTYMNPAAERLFGWTSAELLGRKMHDMTHYRHPDGRPFPIEECAGFRVLHEGKVLKDYDDVFIRKDGTFFPVVYSSSPLVAEGKVAGLVVVFRDATERKRAEEALRRQREWLRVTLASIGDAVITTDTESRVTFLNPVAESLTGWTQPRAAGQPLERVFRVINEHTRKPMENPVVKSLREGRIIGLANHTLLIANDGTERPIDDSASPIRDEAGNVLGVVLVFRDVTEARRAIQTRLHLAAIVESSEDAIISKSLDGRIVSWNQGAERLYGYTAAEMIGKPLALLVPPEQPDELPAVMERLQRGGRVEHFVTQRVHKDGSRLTVSLTISPVRDPDGRVIGASKVARDLTALKRNEDALRFLADASRLLADVLDVSSTLGRVARLAVPHFADWCAVDMLDEQGGLRRVAVAHVDPNKVKLGFELFERYPPDPAAPFGAWHILRGGKSELYADIPDAELVATIKDAEHLRILRALRLQSYIGVPLAVRGKVLGVLTFVSAESRRRYDPADLAVAEDLGHRAAIAIDNARLYAELKEADRRKDEFLAMLSHELRNPLAPIRNALHILGAPGVDPATLDHAREVTERQVQHLVRLVDDLLDVSRIMRGKVDLRKQPVELTQIIGGAIEIAQPMIDSHGQQLSVSLPSEPLLLEADPTRLGQVLGNLLHNAAKFSQRAGKVSLTVVREGDEAVIRVRDEGIGIAPDVLPRIFELFVQADRTLERTQGGLGIGLTVVRRLVEMHGGRIAAYSAGLGKGSEFVVRLPLVKATTPAGPGRVAPAPAAQKARRVLVVDDNVDAAETTAMLLKAWGHHVRMAYNGTEALQAAQDFGPEIVLLDIGLPGMSGYEVAQRLRQQPKHKNIKLVAVTGYGQEDDRRRSSQAGFDEHLTKPVEPHTLQRLVVMNG